METLSRFHCQIFRFDDATAERWSVPFYASSNYMCDSWQLKLTAARQTLRFLEIVKRTEYFIFLPIVRLFKEVC